jgi:hypothetical protein
LVPRITNITWAQLLVPQLVGDSMELVETLLQWPSVSATACIIDSTIGTVEPKLGGPHGLLHFLHYNIPLRVAPLSDIGVELSNEEALGLQDIGNIHAIPALLNVSSRIEQLIEPHHLPAVFDVPQSS